jgi:hypothetical protein
VYDIDAAKRGKRGCSDVTGIFAGPDLPNGAIREEGFAADRQEFNRSNMSEASAFKAEV